MGLGAGLEQKLVRFESRNPAQAVGVKYLRNLL